MTKAPLPERRLFKMCQYSYPAVFKKEHTLYIGHFPDLDCPIAFGHSFEDAYEMAEEELLLLLYDREAGHKSIPHPTPAGKIAEEQGNIVLVIMIDTQTVSGP